VFWDCWNLAGSFGTDWNSAGANDMMAANNWLARLQHERIWAVLELCRATGNEQESCTKALANHLDGTIATGTHLSMLGAIVNQTPNGKQIFHIQYQLAQALDHFFPPFVNIHTDISPLTDEHFATAQSRIREQIDLLEAAGEVLDDTTGLAVVEALNEGVPVADAGGDHPLAKVGHTVVLDTSGSSDPQGKPLGYFWEALDYR